MKSFKQFTEELDKKCKHDWCPTGRFSRPTGQPIVYVNVQCSKCNKTGLKHPDTWRIKLK